MTWDFLLFAILRQKQFFSFPSQHRFLRVL
jgi:hypothetical protein